MADIVDPRQRRSAAMVLAAVDLPADMADVSKVWGEAARIAKGMTVQDLLIGDRRAALVAARAILDEVIAEIDAARADR